MTTPKQTPVMKNFPDEQDYMYDGGFAQEEYDKDVIAYRLSIPKSDERKSLSFTEFQVKLRGLLWIDSAGFDNEWMHDFFEDFRSMQYSTLKEWADFFFQDVTKDTHSYCLISKL